MQESKSPGDAATSLDQIDKSAANIEAEQNETEKYKSEPEGKVKFGDYLVCIHNESPANGEANLYLAISEYSHMVLNGTLYYYLLDLLPL